MNTAGKYVNKLTTDGFSKLITARYGKDSLVIKAFEYLCANMNKEKGFIRKFSGEDYFIHPQAVAEILIDMVDANADCVIVALLHDCIEDMEEGTEEEIRNIFGDEITRKILLVTKRPDIDYHVHENLYEYLMNTLTDEDAVLVKIADRMNNNSTYSGASLKKKQKKTEETRTFFVPLAESAEKTYPHNEEFYKIAKTFFEMDI